MRTVVATLAGIVVMGTLAAAQGSKVEAGKASYTTLKCSTCHALNGAGGKLASKMDGVGTKLTEAQLKDWLVKPAELEAKLDKKPKMPMSTFMKKHKLTDADVDALVAYLKTLK